MTSLEDKLTAALYRTTCPESSELGDYHLEMVPRERARYIKQHLAECPHCTRELVQLESYLAELSSDLAYSLGDRVRILIARLVPSDLSALAAPAPAFALRGDSSEILSYEADDAQLTLEIQDDPEKPGFKSLLGLIIGIEPADFEAHLWRDAELVTTANVDALGNVSISDLSPGVYELILSSPGLEIHVQDLVL